MQAEAALLREAGHDVVVEEVSNDGIVSAADKAKTLLGAGDNRQSARWIAELLDETRPAIVHVHNFFPLLSPSIHIEAARQGFAVVQTLHNYRLTCANGMHLRNEEPCVKCCEKGPHWAAIRRCYRDSLPGSLAALQMQRKSLHSPEWRQSVHRFVALTEFARKHFEKAGLPADRLTVKPNFVPDPGPPPADPRQRKGFLFVGRLSAEKGARMLVEAWRNIPGEDLTIAGDGPELERLKAAAPTNVRFTGRLSAAEVRQEMRRAAFLVMPSLWYEGLPVTLIEAFANGLPIIASDIGALRELVKEGKNGFTFAPGSRESLTAAVVMASSLGNAYPAAATQARATYERHYRPEANLRQLEEIYEAALACASITSRSCNGIGRQAHAQ